MKTIKNNQQGFTLIELLAIIVILAVIMAIAIPQVLNVVNGSKSSAWKNNVKMITKAIELNTQLYDVETGAYTYTMTDLCESPDTVNEISKSSDTDIECNNGIFTLRGTGQFDGKTATIDCSSGSCNMSVTEGDAVAGTCPGPDCRYLYAINTYRMGSGGSTLVANATTANYRDIIIVFGKPYFFGVILSNGDHGTIQRAFICLEKNGSPFCIEGTTDGSSYVSNKTKLNSLYGPYNESTHLGCEELVLEGITGTRCTDSNFLTISAAENGIVNVEQFVDYCVIMENVLQCYSNSVPGGGDISPGGVK